MKREQYPPEIMAQASLDVAKAPELGGNASLANRVQEVIEAGEDPFHLVFQAIKDGRVIMERAEKIRLEQIAGRKTSIK